MKTEPGHGGAPEGGPLADAVIRLSPPACSQRPQALKTALRLIDQEHNNEAASVVCACTDQEPKKIIFIQPLKAQAIL